MPPILSITLSIHCLFKNVLCIFLDAMVNSLIERLMVGAIMMVLYFHKTKGDTVRIVFGYLWFDSLYA